MTTLVIDSADFVEAQEGAKNLIFEDEKQQANFELGVSMAIHSWEALEIAVANQWGGAQSEEKRDWITAIVVDLFHERLVDIQLIEDTILNAMMDEFDVNVEDDSSLPIADRVIKFYRQAADRDFTQIHALYESWQVKQAQRAQRGDAHHHVHINEDPENPDDSDDEESEEENNHSHGQAIEEDVQMEDADEQPQGPIVDDDGFELVQKKGRRKY